MSSMAAAGASPKKPNFIVGIWQKLDIKPFQILVAMKGPIAAIIALAAYESTAWANRYSTLGYLVAIAAMLALPIQPRAKFARSLLADMIGVLIATAVGVVGCVSVVAARRATGGENTNAYNSSAAATAAVWLFFNIWLANTIRAKNPVLQIPGILYTIFSVVFATSSHSFPNMPYAFAFTRRLIEVFFTGFGLATGVSLFILPTSSRMIVTKQLAGVLGLMKANLVAHGHYMETVTGSHQLRKERTEAGLPPTDPHKQDNLTPSQLSAKELREKYRALALLFTTMKAELSFAKKEVGYGKLSPDDYTKIAHLLSKMLIPIGGLGTFIDIAEAITKHHEESATYVDRQESAQSYRSFENDEWEEAIALNSDAYAKLRETMLAGLTHFMLVLELVPKPKTAKSDPEKAAGADPSPGEPGYASFYSTQVEKFHASREVAICNWCKEKKIELPSAFWDDPAVHYKWDDLTKTESNIRHKQNEQQLYLFLYAEYLSHRMARSILDAVEFADSKVADGSMKKKRLINPGFHRIKRLLATLILKEDSEEIPYEGQSGQSFIRMGDSYSKKHDPEHLPPATTYQKITNYLRYIPHFLESEAASFGFRAAVATMSIGILDFLAPTYLFFTQQRGIWALIMTGISMSPQAGQGIFGFTLRIVGSVIAMAGSYATWYMCDQKIGAVLPIMWLFMSCFFLVLLKMPQIAIVCIISAVTMVLIIGYEIQANKVGVVAVEANGQDYYPLYELAPLRVLTVIIGLTVAFIWTYFPYPVTTHSTLRKDLGGTLYLLGNFYSSAHTTIGMRIKEGSKIRDPPPGSPMAKLDKARDRAFGKFLLKLSQLRTHSAMTRWEPTIGGCFPRSQYNELIDSMRNVFSYTSLMVYSSTAFTIDESADSKEWVQDFRKYAQSATVTSQEITSLLSLVSASIRNGQPLPPYLRPPHPYRIAEGLEAIDANILSVKHINEPCYAAFAVLEIASTMLSREMEKIIKMVKELVGEADFSFELVSDESESSSRSTLVNRCDSNGPDGSSEDERRLKKERTE